MPEASFSSTRAGRGEEADAFELDGDFGGVGEGDGFGFAVAGVVSGDEELDADAGFGVAEVLAVREGRQVAEAVEGDEDVDVDGEAAEAMTEEGHTARDGVENVQLFQSGRDASEGIADGTSALEEALPSLIQSVITTRLPIFRGTIRSG